MEIKLEEAAFGTEKQIEISKLDTCDKCQGSGAEPGSKPENCPTCSGAGKVRAQQGFFTIERTCPSCHGRGRIVRNPCKTCRGNAHVQKERTLAVNIPPGVEEGTRIRLTGEGQAGLHGGPPGDLYIFISLAPHPIFQRDGHDLHCRAPVSFIMASLGGTIEIPHQNILGTTAKKVLYAFDEFDSLLETHTRQNGEYGVDEQPYPLPVLVDRLAGAGFV